MFRGEELKDIIYLFVNSVDKNVTSYGISFQQFIQSMDNPPANLLLLKHRYEEGEVHFDTQFPYATGEQVMNLAREDLHKDREFCWVDFEDVFNLDALEGQELAELLYLAHLKKHLSLPFYNTLNNRFAYLTDNDGWKNKTYYKNWTDFYQILSHVLADKLSELKLDKSLLSFWKKKEYPPIDLSVIRQLNTMLTEGVAICFSSSRQSRGQINLPIWIVGDYYDMDDMLESFQRISSSSPHAYLSYDKKQKTWSINFLANKENV